MISYDGEKFEVVKVFEMPDASAEGFALTEGKYLLAKKREKVRPPPLLLGDAICLHHDEVDPLIVIDRLPGRIKVSNTLGQTTILDEQLYELRAYSVWRDAHKIWKRASIEVSTDVNNKGLAMHEASPSSTHKGS